MTHIQQSSAGRIRGYLLAGVAVLTCPCHVPILILLLSGTAAGAWLADYMLPAVAILAIVFVLSLGAALRALRAGEGNSAP